MQYALVQAMIEKNAKTLAKWNNHDPLPKFAYTTKVFI